MRSQGLLGSRSRAFCFHASSTAPRTAVTYVIPAWDPTWLFTSKGPKGSQGQAEGRVNYLGGMCVILGWGPLSSLGCKPTAQALNCKVMSHGDWLFCYAPSLVLSVKRKRTIYINECMYIHIYTKGQVFIVRITEVLRPSSVLAQIYFLFYLQKKN